jgi:thioredoxin 1
MAAAAPPLTPTDHLPTVRRSTPVMSQPGAATKTTTDAQFATDVLQSDKPVLVDFWAEWCGPCKMVAPVLEEIASENAGKLDVVKLNIDENPGAARDYQIMSIPTMAVFSGGKIVKQIVGAKPKAAILKDLEAFL